MGFNPTVIFSINNTSPMGCCSFYEQLALRGVGERHIKALLGSYNGGQEVSFIMAQDMFDLHVRDTLFLDSQESVLHVTGCNKAYAVLEYLADGRREGLGSMCEVDREIAETYPSWTFRPDLNRWYICAKINPDHAGELGAYEAPPV